MTTPAPAPAGPIVLAKLGFRRAEAAACIGVSPTKFDLLVKDGRMPRPHRIDGVVLWRADELIAAFDRLTGRDRGGIDVEEDTWRDY